MPGDDSLELFPETAPAGVPRDAPLAERMRPRSLDEVVGQEALLAPGRQWPPSANHLPGAAVARSGDVNGNLSFEKVPFVCKRRMP